MSSTHSMAADYVKKKRRENGERRENLGERRSLGKCHLAENCAFSTSHRVHTPTFVKSCQNYFHLLRLRVQNLLTHFDIIMYTNICWWGSVIRYITRVYMCVCAYLIRKHGNNLHTLTHTGTHTETHIAHTPCCCLIFSSIQSATFSEIFYFHFCCLCLSFARCSLIIDCFVCFCFGFGFAFACSFSHSRHPFGMFVVGFLVFIFIFTPLTQNN